MRERDGQRRERCGQSCPVTLSVARGVAASVSKRWDENEEEREI